MGNGFTTERMLEMILERMDRVDEKQNAMLAQITGINANGCAHRRGDSDRVERLETWRDRSIIGIILTLLTSLGALLGFIFFPHK